MLQDYGQRIELLTRAAVMVPGSSDVLDPPVLRLGPEATALWVQFHDQVEAAIGRGGELQEIRAFGAKMPEHAGRLAAVLAVFADPDTLEVPPEMMACGIELARHYARELLRLQGAAIASPDLQLAKRLLEWIQARSEPRFHLAQIYQRSLNAIGDKATAQRIVGILEEHGWVRRLLEGTMVDGAPRRHAWELVP